MPPRKSGDPWTDAQVAKIETMVAKGKSTEEIAKALERTAAAIRSKAQAEKISLKPPDKGSKVDRLVSRKKHFKDERLIVEIHENAEDGSLVGSITRISPLIGGTEPIYFRQDDPTRLSVSALKEQLNRKAMTFEDCEHDCKEEGCPDWIDSHKVE